MGVKSIIKRIFSLSYYCVNNKEYRKVIDEDYKFNASFRGVKKLPKDVLESYEWNFIKCYRKYQCNQCNVWASFYKMKLHKLELKTGIDFEDNINIGKGLIIGHWGKIVVNGQAKLGDQVFITHGVTIGRDVRGKRAGVPTIGNRVCVRTNSTIVGNIIIGDDVLIAPNTFVNFDVPSHSIVIGNPASIHHRDNATEGHLGEL